MNEMGFTKIYNNNINYFKDCNSAFKEVSFFFCKIVQKLITFFINFEKFDDKLLKGSLIRICKVLSQ